MPGHAKHLQIAIIREYKHHKSETKILNMNTNNDYLSDTAGVPRRIYTNNQLLERIAKGGLGGLTTEQQALIASIPDKADLVNGKVPESQLPAYIDNVEEHTTQSEFPATGEADVIYISVADNAAFRWGGTQYVQIASGLVLGETEATAFPGSRGVALEGASANKLDKVSSSNRVYATNASGQQVTIPHSEVAMSTSLVMRSSSGHIQVNTPIVDAHPANKKYVDDLVSAMETEGPIALGTTAQYFRGDKTWQDLDKNSVGLSNIDNTSDEDKPVSAPQRNALAVKADLVNGRVPESQLPSYIHSVQEFAKLADFPVSGQSDVVYLAVDANKPYRWGGSSYVEISSAGVALGETASTAYRGDRGKVAYDHTLKTDNPHGVTKEQIGLTNVDNTSDAAKPVSTPQQIALDSKVNKANPGVESAYVVAADGSDTTIRVAEALINRAIPRRDAAGRLQSHAPISGNDLTNKSYVDGRVEAKADVNYVNSELEKRIIGLGAGRIIVGETDPRTPLRGAGSPGGIIAAPVGSLYEDTNATDGYTHYTKRAGTGNTGWDALLATSGVPKITASPTQPTTMALGEVWIPV